MSKELDKVMDDYKGVLQKLEEFDQQGGKQISQKMLWEKARLKAQKYDMTDPKKTEFQSVPIPKEVIERLEKLRDSKELPMSMWSLITGILDTFTREIR